MPNDPHERKIDKPVVRANVQRKRKSVGKKFSDLFFEDMTFEDIVVTFINDRLLPDIKDGLYGVIDGFVETLFYGKAKPRHRAGSGSSTSYTSYSQSGAKREYRSTTSRVANNFDDIVFETRQDADNVLDSLLDALSKYKEVSIGDFYDAAGVSRNGFTDENFGWTNLATAYVSRSRGGWVLNMPKVVELK